MFNLYFAGKLTKQVDTQLFHMGVNHLYSYTNDRDLLEHWVSLIRKYGKKSKLFIDSGAFSAWTRNQYISVDDYIDFINDRSDCIDYYGQIDCIPGTIFKKPTSAEVEKAGQQTWENFLYMYYKMKNPGGLMYTFHVGEPLWQLSRALEWKDKDGNPLSHMAFGGMVGKNRKTQISFIEKCFSVIKHSTNPNIKVHAFGLIAPDVLEVFPFYSADSSGWLQVGQNGNIYVPTGIVLVSSQQMDKKEHILNQSPEAIKNLKNYVEKFGYTLEGLMNNYADRSIWNVEFLRRWAENYEVKTSVLIRRRLF